MAPNKQQMMDRAARLIADLQDAVQQFDESAAAQLGLNLTDLRCLRQVVQEPTSPSQLADLTGLTRAAISTAVDRLEKANLATRVADPSDRRRARVEATDAARRRVADIWGPLETDGRRELSGYSKAELEVIVDFLTKSIDLHRRNTDPVERFTAGET